MDFCFRTHKYQVELDGADAAVRISPIALQEVPEEEEDVLNDIVLEEEEEEVPQNRLRRPTELGL